MKLEFENVNTNKLHDELIKAGVNPKVVESLNYTTWIEVEESEEEAVNEVVAKHNPISSLRESKIAEIKYSCNVEILAGFKSVAKGTEELYGFDYEDQINIEALKNNVALGIIADGTLTYYKKGGDCEPWSNTEFMTLYSDAMTFKMNRITTAKAIIKQIETATESELEGIQWVNLADS